MTCTITRVRAAVCSAIAAIGSVVHFASAKDVQQLDVSVTITDTTGSPVADVPVIFGSPTGALGFAMTGEDGIAGTSDLDVPKEADMRLVWALIDDGFSVMPIVPDYPAAKARLDDLRANYALPGFATSTYTETETVVALQMVLFPGSVVRGRTLDATGQPVTMSVVPAQSRAEIVNSEVTTGQFALERVHPTSLTRVVALPKQLSMRGFVAVKDVSLSALDVDVNIGDLQVKNTPIDASIDLRVEFTGELPFDFDRHGLKPSPVAPTVVFVDVTDADRLFFLRVDRNSGIAIAPDEVLSKPGPVVCPSGDFFLVLGHPASAAVAEVRRAIRDGNVQQLTDAGLTRLQVKAGQVATRTIDFETSMNALRQYISAID